MYTQITDDIYHFHYYADTYFSFAYAPLTTFIDYHYHIDTHFFIHVHLRYPYFSVPFYIISYLLLVHVYVYLLWPFFLPIFAISVTMHPIYDLIILL